MTSSVSLATTPLTSPDKSGVEKEDEKEDNKTWVAAEVIRLNKLHQEIVKELKDKNEAQSRMIALYNQERLTRPQLQPQPPMTTLPEGPTIAQEIALPERPTTANVQIPIQQQTTTQINTDKGEDELYTKGDPWNIGKVVEKYAEYVKESMLKGAEVTIQEINVLGNGQLVHNWGTLVRAELKGKAGWSQTFNKAKTLQDVRTAGDNIICNTPANGVRLNFDSPNSSSIGNSCTYGGDLNRLADGDCNDNGGDRSPGDPNGGNGTGNGITNKYNRRDDNEDRHRKEFLLVKSSNVNIETFTGFNLNRSPYIPFNKSLRKLILTQGQDGEELLTILDHIDTYGDNRFATIKLKALADVYPNAYEYALAVNAALLTWTEGAVHGLVEHGCDNGLEAWRRLYNRYLPAAEDLQNLLMEELMILKPVTEQDIDNLSIDIGRLIEWYIKADSQGEAMNANWVRAAFIKNLPRSITQHLAIQLRQAQTIDAVYNLVKIYLHDHSTGLPKGQGAAKLYLTEGDEAEE